MAAYLLISIVATWPLSRDLSTRIAADPGDPILNTSILVWNATTRLFSTAWWNAPHYYPSLGVSAFTENLAGMSPIASPVYWLTGNPILAYNLALFLTWPLSALAAYLLVRFIAKREDAAILAGLSFGFSPYRILALGHIQTLATFGVPLLLLGLHGFLEERRWPWLVLFGLAWLQQALANGYYTLYGAVLIGLWLAYFCTRPGMWKPGLTIVGAWALASVPLAPILLKYREIHEHYGLHRTLNEILYFSAKPSSWLEVSSDVWFWRSWLPEGIHNLFPGVTAVALVLAGGGVLLLRPGSGQSDATPARRWLRIGLGAVTALSIAAIAASLYFGQIDISLAGIPFRMRNLNRSLVLLFACGVPLLLMTPRTREALARRSPLVFYVVMTMVIAILCCGPVLRVGEEIILSPAPYGWLMPLPGFNELRVPTQIKMISILCLAVAAGLAYAAVLRSSSRAARAVFVMAAIGLLLDGWPVGAQMATPPAVWAEAEPPNRTEPILELPLGPGGDDFGATLRAAIHHRRVMNGVSGYDPPHYQSLVVGLGARDPAMFPAIASLGPFDVVVNRAADPDGAVTRYAANAPGAVRVADDGRRTVYRIPAGPAEPALGAVLPIVRVEAKRHPEDWAGMHDGRTDTGWGDYPQTGDGWIVIDLGAVHEVGGLTHNIAVHVLDFPRRLAIDVSTDKAQWECVWEGPTAAQAFLAFVREPTRAGLRFSFEPRPARFVRLRQLDTYQGTWRVAELQVHAPLR
jgi:hypothetical protein